jgi:thiamine-phosphate pyrophosphorylase
MFKEGLPLLHLRKPGYDYGAMSGYLLNIPPEFYNRIVIHSCYELVQEFNLGGIHITGSNTGDKNGLISRYKNKEGFTLSRSCHELIELDYCDPCIDYVFLSPIFDSISKRNYRARFKTFELTEALKRSKLMWWPLGV